MIQLQFPAYKYVFLDRILAVVDRSESPFLDDQLVHAVDVDGNMIYCYITAQDAAAWRASQDEDAAAEVQSCKDAARADAARDADDGRAELNAAQDAVRTGTEHEADCEIAAQAYAAIDAADLRAELERSPWPPR